jgi:signal transduction histidine kinase
MNSDDLTQLLSTLRQLQAPPLPLDVARLLPSRTQPSEKTSFSQDEMKLLLSSLPPSLPQPSPTASIRIDTIEGPSERRTEEEVTKERYRDIKTLSFPEALPLLTNLAQDQKFLNAIGEMKVSQEQLELRMKDERNRIARELKHELS